jgi:hypothetical protein
VAESVSSASAIACGSGRWHTRTISAHDASQARLNLPPGSRCVLPRTSPLRTGREGCPFIRLKPLAFVASLFGDVADGTRGVQGVCY